MDIFHAKEMKKYIRAAIWLLQKKLHTSLEQIHQDLSITPNDAIGVVTQIINDTADIIDSPYQEKTVRELSEMGLWIAYKDTGYKDILFYMLQKILDNKEILEPLIAPYVKKPKDMYVNSWAKSKKNTEKKKVKGEIPKYGKAADEKIFTPTIQNKRLQKL